MNSRAVAAILLLVAGWANPSLAATAKPDVDRDRLSAQISALDQDPDLAPLAGLERFRARQAVAALPAPNSRDRPQAQALAETWVQAATIAAQAQQLEQQSLQLDRERDQIMLEASRRDAEQARREADRLRLQTLAQQEEAERLAANAEASRQAGEQAAADAQAAAAEAAQARKLADAREREAQLAREEARLATEVDNPAGAGTLPPSRKVAGKTVYTLSGAAFASGSSRLTDAAIASLRRLAASLPKRAKLLIEGHTDSQGQPDSNLALSRLRAEAVQQALIDDGIAPARLKAVGLGQADPVADNGTAEGRARNRRVEVTVQ